MERARQSRYHSGMTKTPKRPRDPNQLAKFIIDAATADTDPGEDDKKNPAAVERGRLGGVKGGAARAAALTPDQRSEAARKAVQARWSKKA